MKNQIIKVKLRQILRCDYCKKNTLQVVSDVGGKDLQVFVCEICKKSTWFLHINLTNENL